jgi:hypothetical protein
MPTTYSTNLRVALPQTGEDAGTWGTIVNQNITAMLEQAITGVAAVVMPADSNYTLTAANGVSDQARCAVLSITSSVSLTATRQIQIPNVTKTYVVYNGTTGSQGLTITIGSGFTVTVPNGQTWIVYCDGANTWPCSTGSTAMAVSGALTAGTTGAAAGAVAGEVRGSGSFLSTGAATSGVGNFNTANGTGGAWYGAGWVNTGTVVQFRQTASQASQASAQTASANSYIPFAWNLGTGAVTIDGTGVGVTFGGQVSATQFNGAGTGLTGTAASLTAGNATAAVTATNLAGGSNGTVPYQSAAGTTVQLSVGSAGQLYQSGGVGAPSWTSALANGTTATTQTAGDNTTKLATTAFVTNAVAGSSAIGSYFSVWATTATNLNNTTGTVSFTTTNGTAGTGGTTVSYNTGVVTITVPAATTQLWVVSMSVGMSMNGTFSVSHTSTVDIQLDGVAVAKGSAFCDVNTSGGGDATAFAIVSLSAGSHTLKSFVSANSNMYLDGKGSFTGFVI